MDIEQLRKARRDLDKFLRQFDDCFKTKCSRQHLRSYVRGQVSDLPRKCIAPIALMAHVPPRTLQEFMELKEWKHEGVGQRVQEFIVRRHAHPEAIGVIDETSDEKKGDKTVGVQRQYCGATGKTDNCTVSVHLGYVAGDFHALVDGDLYIPEGWFADPQRCREAGVPEAVFYRTKWQIAVDLLKRTLSHGLVMKYLTADETYGRCSEFRREVAGMKLLYVVEAPCSTCGWTRKPRVLEPPEPMGPGRPGTRRRLAPGAPPHQRVDVLAKRSAASWKTYHIKETDKGPVVWQAQCVRFFPWEDDLPGEQSWLIVARDVLDGQTKYFLSNAPADTPPEVMLHIAFSRPHIEQLFEASKGQVGLDHYEVRHYQPLRRHLILSMVSLLFLMELTQTLRGEKSGVDNLPGSAGDRSPTRPGHAPSGTNSPTDPGRLRNRLLAAVQRAGQKLPSQAATAPT